MNTYRALTAGEIQQLEENGCRSTDWTRVRVNWTNDKSIRNVCDAKFSGDVRLGIFEKEFILPGGVPCICGVRHAHLHNVTIGDNCLIRKVGEYIANYQIGSDCLIDNIDIMAVEGRTTFGAGTEVSVLNETGGREVVITDRLSSQTAYIMALYRHRKGLHDKLAEIARRDAARMASGTGSIGNGVSIRNCGTLLDVRIGDFAKLEGVRRLRNGSICSNADAPVLIGSGVMAEDFIICSGASVEDGVMLNRCFVGQATKLGHGYSASDSLFFSNCQGENGEACAIFAGPFTVTHHKSTLLIAGMYSFMNAGSGSNQSNHMYKLGPIHQGTLERGAKRPPTPISSGRPAWEPSPWSWAAMSPIPTPPASPSPT